MLIFHIIFHLWFKFIHFASYAIPKIYKFTLKLNLCLVLPRAVSKFMLAVPTVKNKGSFAPKDNAIIKIVLLKCFKKLFYIYFLPVSLVSATMSSTLPELSEGTLKVTLSS